MKLTFEQLLKLTDLQAKTCPNCKSESKKDLDPNIYTLVAHSVNNNTVECGGTIFQSLLSVVCPDCSYAMLFNLKVLGVIDK